MCGICGVIQIRGERRPVLSTERLEAMVDAMTHRGPDDRGTFAAPGVALGVRRLSIVDVDGGHQPVGNEDGSVWAVQNGELYEHARLRSELARDGHRFATRCDTEVLPHLYERDGTSFPRSLRGMYGIAVWDDGARTAVLARDRLGIKPLYYAEAGDLLVFASELKSLLRSGLVEPDLDLVGIDAYLSLGFFPTPLTPLAHVRKLPPGQILVVADGRVRLEEYWTHPLPAPRLDRTRAETAELVLSELEESVRMRLMADVPVGALLSGGLDSSLVAALMARNMTRPVQTFSVGFAGAGPRNELADARRVASALGAEHHELELPLSDPGLEIEDVVWSLDEPLADLSALGLLALSRLASRHVAVALSGQGADELFGGYARHRVARRAELWWRLPGLARSPLALAARALPGSSGDRLARLQRAPDAATLAGTQRQLDLPARERVAAGALRAVGGGAAEAVVAERLAGVRARHLPATLYLDARLGLVDDMLQYFDRASMAYSLELRVPFLDHRLVELAATIPASHKVRGRELKSVLRLAARGLVPDEVLRRPKVGFFDGSAGSWLRAQTGSAVQDHLLAPRLHCAGLLDPLAVRRLALAPADGAGPGRQRLVLAILLLEVWLATFLPRALAGAEPVRERIALAG